MSLESELKDLQSRYQTCLHRADKLEDVVALLRNQIAEKDAEIERLTRVGNVDLWEREKERTFKDLLAREAELTRKVEELTENLDEQKFAHLKAQLDIQSRVRKSEIKAEMGLKMSEDEYYTHIDSLKKDILRQRIQTAKQEKEKKQYLEIFRGIVRGLRLDLRICMEKVDSEWRELLSIEEEEDLPFRGLDQLQCLMAILDDIQYSCSKETVVDAVDNLPAHYSSLEAGLKVASDSHLRCSNNAQSLPSSPVSSTRKHLGQKGSPVKSRRTPRSLTAPEKKTHPSKLPLVGVGGYSPPKQQRRRGLNDDSPQSSSLPGSPLCERRVLTRRINLPSGDKMEQMSSLSPHPPRRLLSRPVAEPNVRINRRQLHPLKLGVVTPSPAVTGQEKTDEELRSSSCVSFSVKTLSSSP